MEIKHDAFISYNHGADHELAEALEAGMEKLAKPLFSLRAIDLFRDTTGLAPDPNVWGKSSTMSVARNGWCCSPAGNGRARTGASRKHCGGSRTARPTGS